MKVNLVTGEMTPEEGETIADIITAMKLRCGIHDDTNVAGGN